jgi:hypothetical protein
LLVAIDPSGEGHERHLQAGDIGRHGPIVPCLIPDPITGSGPAEFSDTTGLTDLAHMFNPVIRGWIGYFGRYHKSALYPVFRHLNLHPWVGGPCGSTSDSRGIAGGRSSGWAGSHGVSRCCSLTGNSSG